MSSPTSTVQTSPSSGDDEAYAVYEQRVTSGFYDDLADKFKAMGPAALVNTDYNVHFTRAVTDWSKNYSYNDTKSGNEFQAVVFGEIVHSSAGTLLSAKGNHYHGKAGGPFKALDDESKCKDVLVIGQPTLATVPISDAFIDQIGALNAIRESDEQEEITTHWRGHVKEWIRNRNGDTINPCDLITLHIGPKYVNPNGGSTVSSKRIRKRKLDVSSADDIRDDPSSISRPVVQAGAFYEPTMLPDYGGPYFRHVHNKLVQRDIRNIDNELIPPWEAYSALRPGTLIMAICSLHAFLLRSDTPSGLDRRAYQINIHSLRVLDHSKEPLQIPTRPGIPSTGPKADYSTLPDIGGGQAPSKSADAFANFSVPKKRRAESSMASNGPAPPSVISRGQKNKQKQSVKDSGWKGKGKDNVPTMETE